MIVLDTNFSTILRDIYAFFLLYDPFLGFYQANLVDICCVFDGLYSFAELAFIDYDGSVRAFVGINVKHFGFVDQIFENVGSHPVPEEGCHVV